MKKVESGVIFEGYEFVAGNKYIYAVSSEAGKTANGCREGGCKKYSENY